MDADTTVTHLIAAHRRRRDLHEDGKDSLRQSLRDAAGQVWNVLDAAPPISSQLTRMNRVSAFVAMVSVIGCASGQTRAPEAAPQPEQQTAAGGFPASFASDSVAWQRVVTYVVSSLSTHLVRTAGDTARQPWRIIVPSDEPQRELVAAQLRTILRARPVVAKDSVAYEVEFGRLTVANDTARIEVREDFAIRCRGKTRTGGYANVHKVYVVRVPPGFWSVARSQSVLHGDRFGCS